MRKFWTFRSLEKGASVLKLWNFIQRFDEPWPGLSREEHEEERYRILISPVTWLFLSVGLLVGYVWLAFVAWMTLKFEATAIQWCFFWVLIGGYVALFAFGLRHIIMRKHFDRAVSRRRKQQVGEMRREIGTGIDKE